MKQKLIEHTGSILFVGIILYLAALILQPAEIKSVPPSSLVGALDSIADIAGSAIGIDLLWSFHR